MHWPIITSPRLASPRPTPPRLASPRLFKRHPRYANASSAQPHRPDGQASTRTASGGAAASRGEYEYKDGGAEDKESDFAIPVPPIPDRFEEIEAMTLDQVSGRPGLSKAMDSSSS